MKLDIKSTVILRSCVVDGTETGDVTWDGVSLYSFIWMLFQNGEGGSRSSISTKDRDTFILRKIYTKHGIMKKRLSE